MKITRQADQGSAAAPASYFTGDVQFSPIVEAPAPARLRGARVSFAPGARTAWHTHPLGQTLIVVEGCGWIQLKGEPVQTLAVGDVVWIEPGERHWHGATATAAMTHIALQEALDGTSADWLEHVTDEDYMSGSPGA